MVSQAFFHFLCFALLCTLPIGTDLLGDDGRDGVGVSFYPGIEFQQVFYVDWLLAHQLDGQRIGLIRYRRHLSAQLGDVLSIIFRN